jgi:hypothetical protein
METVQKWVDTLQNVTQQGLRDIEKEVLHRRLEWFRENGKVIQKLECTDLVKAYEMILMKIGIERADAPIVEGSKSRIIFHSKNFCPSLEACKILGLDTKVICRAVFEKPTEKFIQRLNPQLRFSRNYNHIRPYAPYCEEFIILARGCERIPP